MIIFIGIEDIADGNEKLTLGLIWRLIQRYSSFGDVAAKSLEDQENVQLGEKVDDTRAMRRQQTTESPKAKLLHWIHEKIPSVQISNFSTDWNNGQAICELVKAFAPGNSF